MERDYILKIYNDNTIDRIEYIFENGFERWDELYKLNYTDSDYYRIDNRINYALDSKLILVTDKIEFTISKENDYDKKEIVMYIYTIFLESLKRGIKYYDTILKKDNKYLILLNIAYEKTIEFFDSKLKKLDKSEKDYKNVDYKIYLKLEYDNILVSKVLNNALDSILSNKKLILDCFEKIRITYFIMNNKFENYDKGLINYLDTSCLEYDAFQIDLSKYYD